MKVFTSVKRLIKKNATLNQCLLFGIIALILAIFVLYKKKTTIIEGNFTDDASDLYNSIKKEAKSINMDLKYTISRGKKRKIRNKPAWNTIAGQQINTLSDTITIKKRPDVPVITADNCSTHSLLGSDYKNDICETYKGDYQTINKKCNALSNTNCSLLSCCVLLNGNKCIAGSVNGPTYLTDQGNTIDYAYYTYRGKVYPEEYQFKTSSSGYAQHCGMYASNSTNISKECMVQMFNDAGCPNSNPSVLINKSSVYDYSNSSTRYIQNDMKNAVKLLKSNMTAGDNDSRMVCNGADPNNPCDAFNNASLAVSKPCILKMFNDNGCPNISPSNTIDDKFVLKQSTSIKSALIDIMKAFTNNIKYKADNSPNGSDEKMRNQLICYGTVQ